MSDVVTSIEPEISRLQSILDSLLKKQIRTPAWFEWVEELRIKIACLKNNNVKKDKVRKPYGHDTSLIGIAIQNRDFVKVDINVFNKAKWSD